MSSSQVVEESILINVIINRFPTYFHVWDIFIDRLFSRDAMPLHTRCFNKASARRSDDELAGLFHLALNIDFMGGRERFTGVHRNTGRCGINGINVLKCILSVDFILWIYI